MQALETMDLKHFLDARGKIECELETHLKKLHRLKQQLTELNGQHDLRNFRAEISSLKKGMELR